jgi:hypothetical protein
MRNAHYVDQLETPPRPALKIARAVGHRRGGASRRL